jgi:hypothetical protein
VQSHREKLKIYSPLFTVLGIAIVFVLFIKRVAILDFPVLCIIAAILCSIGFYLTGALASKELDKIRNDSSKRAS